MATKLSIGDLIFVGLRGYVVAIHRDTGQTVWTNSELHSGYVTLLLDEDRLIVSTNGYIFCLDPLTGAIRWQNPLTGYGVGVAALASVRGSTHDPLQQYASSEAQRRSAAT